MSKSTGSPYTRPGRCVSRSDKREWTRHLLAKLNKIPPASPALSSMWPSAGLSCGQSCHELSTADGRVSTVLIFTARLPTA
jgi:hypothetical protein